MLKSNLKPIAMAVGMTFVASLAVATTTYADENPFAVNELNSAYNVLAGAEGEGKCGEGKCGEDKGGEGKCGEDKGGEGKCGEDKGGEGKCGEDKGGEGKCGGNA